MEPRVSPAEVHVIGYPEITLKVAIPLMQITASQVCLLLPLTSDLASLLRRAPSLRDRLIFDMLVELDYRQYLRMSIQ